MSPPAAVRDATPTSVTALERAERALLETEARYRILVESLPAIVYCAEPEPPFSPIFVSRAVEALGYSLDEWLTVPDRWVALLHPDDREWVLAETDAAQRDGRPVEYEYRMIAKDGSVRWYHDRGQFVADTGGRVVAWQGVMLDITERKAAEAALAAAAARSRAEFLAVPVPTYAWQREDDDFVLADYNAAAERVTRGLIANALGRRMREFYGDTPEVLAMVDAVLETGEPVSREMDFTYRTTGDRARLVFTCVRAGADLLLVHAHDVTELRATEEALRRSHEQLRQAQKMEAIGRLAGGVAHDFNNILTVIKAHTDFLEDVVPAGEPRADLEEVRKAAQRAASLTRQLLAFSRQQVLEPHVLDVNEVVRDVEKMLRRLIGEDIELVTRLRPNGGTIKADPGQLEQVLVNLAVNARDAMPRGGRLVIATDVGDLDGVRGPRVVLTVSDSGCGMDEATRTRIFEPFFTTKVQGKGTGLGLSTVYGIVEQSGGTIDVESAPGRGATFRIAFPCVAAHDLAAKVPAPPVADGGTETILLVEDETPVRAVAHRILTKCGYHVIEAVDGRDAIVLAARHAGAIDLVLTDAIMPEVSGPALVRHLRESGWTVPVLYMSGYTDDEILRGGQFEPNAAFLHKPFTAQQLALAVRDALGRVRSRP